MKARITLLLPLLLLNLVSVFGQITNLGQPKSWALKTDHAQLNSINMPAFDVEPYRIQDSINDSQKIGPWRFGHKHQVNYNLENSGVWTQLQNGDRIWRLHVKSKDALSINFIFEDLFLPQGATIYIHKPDRSAYLGAYTAINNNVEKTLGTDLISGEEAIIEYYEPVNVLGQGTLTVTNIVHGYRDISIHENEVMKALNSSGDCNRDIKCLTDPEPLWLNESHSVAMIVVGGNGSCTGTLVNNTAQDGTPYFLTANHCLGNPANWAFRFKWIAPTPVCATTANSPDMANNTQFQTANGAVLRASNAGSDFALVEITNLTLAMAQSWGLYYAGWDHTGNAVPAAIGIHHPSGDIMKYARENNALTQVNSGGALCWEVANWDEGVTEPGSSGSGLWDLNHRLVGQLYGGAAACSGTNDNGQYDVYGRFDVSWNGASAATRLRDWLDPSSTSTGTIDGWDPNQPTVALDAGIQGINSPNGNICGGGNITPEVILRNYGSTTLTSVDIEYSVDGGAVSTYSWTGSLATNTSATVTLPMITAGNGPHTFTAATVDPNGGTDENAANDELTSNFTANTNGQLIDFSLTTDCWGSETTWTLEDDLNNELYAGGPYTNVAGGETITEEWCLNVDCYVFTIDDEYGDGMYGSQYGSCNVDGTYTISQDGTVLAEIQAADSDFGDQEVNNFCVASALTPDFSADVTSICAGEQVTFTDLSEGTPTSWDWAFEGGSTSTDQNPVVTYNTPGTYDVTLTIGDGSNTETITFTDYITVNALPVASISASGTTTFCEGGSVTLTSSSSTGNMWSTTETTQAITVNQSGDYTVTVTDGNGCVATSANTTITVNPLPIIGIGTVINPANCGESSGSIQVTGASTGTLNWTGTASGSQGATLPHTVSGLASGSYTFQFTDGNGCVSTQVSQSLSDPGAPATPTISTSGATTFCEGESVTLTSSSLTGNTWSSGETTQSIIVTTSNNYSVTVTDGTCSATSAATSVTVNPTPSTPTISASGSTTLCDGETVTLTSSSASGNLWSTGETTQSIVVGNANTYTVNVTTSGCTSANGSATVTVNSNPAAPVITSDETVICHEGSMELTSSYATGNLWSTGSVNQSITVTTGGNYSTTYTDGNGCTSSASISITLNSEIVVTPTVVHETTGNDGSITLAVSGGNGPYSYDWSNGSTTQNQSGLSEGNYTVTVTDSDGCETNLTVTVSSTVGIAGNTEKLFSIYPNPTNGNVTVSLTSKDQFEKIILTDALGKVVGYYEITNSEISLDMTNLERGLYFIRLIDGKSNSHTERIILQ